MLERKCPKSLIGVSILRDKEILLEVLRQPKTIKGEEITHFTMTYSHKSQNVFPIIKQKFDKFQYSKTFQYVQHFSEEETC